ncbi:hypothetical protein ACIQHV_30790 [Bacillus bombysepticus]|uniref:Uncharacterized protein n=1 Tax=Bacillus thuringiensis serovar kumamotoensis TaxID=132267 RepID=A0A9X6JPB2_BACUK|nr:hypothetical protein [Bacillus thuringiensis]MEC2872573.1 hypothetical protein [Bacillus cereus]OTZ72930.1 hypothetical protein BK769_15090 [Bacillus thuringiensis serovar kumamtoensis]
MRILWIVIALIPVPFLFHFYEYGQRVIQGKEAPFLGIGLILFIIINGFLSKGIKIRYIFLVNIITGVLSLLLASNFIPDDGSWFKPVGRTGAVIFISIIYIIGQLLIRIISKCIFQKND